VFWIATKRIEENVLCDDNDYHHANYDSVDWRIDDGMVMVLKVCCLNVRFLMREMNGAGDCSCICQKTRKNHPHQCST